MTYTTSEINSANASEPTLGELFALADQIGAKYQAPVVHLVTLIHRATGDERVLRVETLTDRFCDVLREVTHLKAVHKLFGYEVFEILDCSTVPF